MEQPVFLSICITSYNRVKELQRCLASIDSRRSDVVEVVISEDCSPQREAIRQVVSLYTENAPYRVLFHTNDHNIGYDRNLKQLVTQASGEYVMFLSDDDCLFPHRLDEFIDALEAQRPAMAYGSFWYGYEEKKRERRVYPSSHVIPDGEEILSRRVYDAILFSGLAFRRELLLPIDAERFVNLNYIQVYMFLSTIYRYGGYFQKTLLIDSVSDGENAYGQVSSSDGGNNLLANRASVFSNLEFNKGLFRVIRMFDEDYGTQIFRQFSKEYSLRSFGGLCRARRHGLKTYHEYWLRLKHSGVILSPACYSYYAFVGLFGARLSKWLFGIPKKLLLWVRRHD